MNESKLVNEIIRALYPYVNLNRDNAGTFITPDGRRVYMGPKGRPDLSGNRRSDGRAVYIEVKVKPNVPTPDQVEYIARRRAEGCLAGIAYSVGDALGIVRG